MATTSPSSLQTDTDRSAAPKPLPIAVGPRVDSAWPAPEDATTRRTIHLVAMTALVLVSGYLVWRAAATLSPLSLALGIPLLVLEFWSLATLALQTPSLWNLDSVRPPRVVHETSSTVTVLIPTRHEPLQVLMPVLAAATRMRLATEIIVLDDGARPWLAGMCDELGIDYRTRIRHEGGTAGQLNAALPGITSDFVVVLSADQVADRDFVSRTLAHFDDPNVALVQTVKAHYNDDSFENATNGYRRPSVQARFERIVSAGRNNLDAAVWNGGGAILRRAAVSAIGGIVQGTASEGIDTSIALHAAGWRTIQHNEILSRGRAAADAAEFADRRSQECAAAMQILRKRAFLLGVPLSMGQRMSYLSMLTDWLTSWRTVGYLLMPALALLAALTPASGPILLFIAAFVAAFALRNGARRSLGRGHSPDGDLTVFGLIRMATTLSATGALVTGRPPRPRPTDRDARRVPGVLVVLGIVNLLAVGWAMAALVGATSVTYPYDAIAIAAVAWSVVNVAFIARAAARIRSRHYGGDRRAAQRIDVEGHVFLDGDRVHVLDVSLTGVRVLSYGEVPEVDSYCAMTFTDPNRRSAIVTGTVVAVQRRPHGHDVRVALESDQTYVMGAIMAEALITSAPQS
jgi:Glycosyltransferase like family 2